MELWSEDAPESDASGEDEEPSVEWSWPDDQQWGDSSRSRRDSAAMTRQLLTRELPSMERASLPDDESGRLAIPSHEELLDARGALSSQGEGRAGSLLYVRQADVGTVEMLAFSFDLRRGAGRLNMHMSAPSVWRTVPERIDALAPGDLIGLVDDDVVMVHEVIEISDPVSGRGLSARAFAYAEALAGFESSWDTELPGRGEPMNAEVFREIGEALSDEDPAIVKAAAERLLESGLAPAAELWRHAIVRLGQIGEDELATTLMEVYRVEFARLSAVQELDIYLTRARLCSERGLSGCAVLNTAKALGSGWAPRARDPQLQSRREAAIGLLNGLPVDAGRLLAGLLMREPGGASEWLRVGPDVGVAWLLTEELRAVLHDPLVAIAIDSDSDPFGRFIAALTLHRAHAVDSSITRPPEDELISGARLYLGVVE